MFSQLLDIFLGLIKTQTVVRYLWADLDWVNQRKWQQQLSTRRPASCSAAGKNQYAFEAMSHELVNTPWALRATQKKIYFTPVHKSRGKGAGGKFVDSSFSIADTCSPGAARRPWPPTRTTYFRDGLHLGSNLFLPAAFKPLFFTIFSQVQKVHKIRYYMLMVSKTDMIQSWYAC